MAPHFPAQKNQAWIQNERKIDNNICDDLRSSTDDLTRARISGSRQIQDLNRIHFSLVPFDALEQFPTPVIPTPPDS